MQKRILLYASCAAMALAIAAPLISAGFDVITASTFYDVGIPVLALSVFGMAAYLVAPAAQFVARHIKQALAMALQSPGGRSPAAALIAAKARRLCMLARERITVTSSWRMCPST